MNNINVLADIARNNGFEESLEEGYLESDIIDNFDSLERVEESVLHADINIIPIHKIGEDYAVRLDSLTEVIESLDVTLSEAMNMVKEANEISEDTRVFCVLPDGINECMTVSDFCEFMTEAKEENIPFAWDSRLACEDFITEAGFFTGLKDKLKEAMKGNNPEKLKKNIKSCQEYNIRLKKELDAFEKLDSHEQKTYMAKKVAKEFLALSVISVGTGALVGGVGGKILAKNMSNAIFTGSPVMNMTRFIKGIKIASFSISYSGNIAYLTSKSLSGKPLAFTPNMYKKVIKNTISANNNSIKACNDRLKELEKGKK